jgi:hypothetical protein
MIDIDFTTIEMIIQLKMGKKFHQMVKFKTNFIYHNGN